MPRMLAMLGEVRGRNVLDLGCGEGGYARELAKRGAAVTGVDGSARLIEVARSRSTPLVMSITHPCFSTPVSHWIRSPDGSLETFAVDRYFDRVAWDSPVTDRFQKPVLRRHRALEDYLAAPLAAGFALRQFVEPGVTDEELAKSKRFRKLARIPYFLFLRWEK